MTHTVVGLFNSRTEAQAAMQELVQQGFIKESIDLSNKRVDETATASTSGASTANTGGVSGFFNSLFGDDEATARNYTDAACDADAILTVQVDSADRAEQARQILDRNGAIDVEERGAQFNQQTVAPTNTTAQNRAQTEGEMAIPVIEEKLAVGKREVERGGARIRSRVIEKPVEETVRLREEHVVVNRRPVNRAVTDADLTNMREGEINLTERAEVAVVGKEARVVEEVVVGKNVTEREETVRDTVKRTDVEVQEVNADAAPTGNSTTGNKTTGNTNS